MFSKLNTPKILLLILLAPLSILAQVSKTNEQRALQRTDSLKTILQLNEEQYPKVYAINLEFAQNADPIVKSDASKISKLKQLKPLDEKRDASLKTVLTKEQFELYIKKKKEHRKSVRENYKNSK